ncbi:MAG TPA: insulinase family protein [Pseudomonadales bacterium]
MLKLIPLALLSLVLGSCANEPARPPAPDPGAPVVIAKSPNDERSYRYLVLDNELRVLLVSDPAADMAAASLVVLRGSFHEPAEFAGLAHFLEHMLFIGTEKYPEVDSFKQFVAAQGGSSNAYTANDHTNYFMEVRTEAFREALDRFAQFFISPLIDPAYTEREKNAVHSEYQLQLKDDGWRGLHAFKAAMSPEHPGSRFSLGTLSTLGPGVDDALKKFREENYSADQMILTALSNEPLDELESWVAPMFDAIENRSIGPAKPLPEAFPRERLPLTLSYRPTRDRRSVTYQFPVPAPDDYYRQKPAMYVTNLLGHEGAGSLHARLKAAGWIESLSSAVYRFDEQNSFITVDMDLTQTGSGHVDEITDLLFAYIDMLKGHSPEAWRYEEQAKVARLGFRFQEKSGPTAFVYRVTPLLDRFPPQDVLAAPYLMTEFDPKLIRRYISYLTPENLLMQMVGPDAPTDRVEPWFEVPYGLTRTQRRPDPTEDPALGLPGPNRFLPDSLELLAADGDGPRLAIDDAGLSLWLDRDTEFGTPRANVYLLLGLRDGLESPRDIAMAQLYQRLVNDASNQLAYPAWLAGLSYRLSLAPQGFQLIISGYSDKQAALLDAVIENLTDVPIDAAKFELYQAELVREWRNFAQERPVTQTYSALWFLLLSSSWPPEALASALENAKPEDLAAWRSKRLDVFDVTGLAHGNVDAAAIDDIADLIREHLPQQGFGLSQPQVRTVAESLKLAVPVDHPDAAMILHVQDPDTSYEARARSVMAAHLLSEPYFTSLRTEQQLGYVVDITARALRRRGAITFLIQSPVASPAQLEAATRQFVTDQLAALQDMPTEQFEESRAGLIARLTEQDSNLGQRSQRYWADIETGVTSLDSRERIAEAVNGLAVSDMIAYLKNLQQKLDDQRLLIYHDGQFPPGPLGGREIESVQAFKRG